MDCLLGLMQLLKSLPVIKKKKKAKTFSILGLLNVAYFIPFWKLMDASLVFQCSQ